MALADNGTFLAANYELVLSTFVVTYSTTAYNLNSATLTITGTSAVPNGATPVVKVGQVVGNTTYDMTDDCAIAFYSNAECNVEVNTPLEYGAYWAKATPKEENSNVTESATKMFEVDGSYIAKFVSGEGELKTTQSIEFDAIMMPQFIIPNSDSSVTPDGKKFVYWSDGNDGKYYSGTYYKADSYLMEFTAVYEPIVGSKTISAIDFGFYEDADDAKIAIYNAGSSYNGGVDDNTMYIVFNSVGYSGYTLTREFQSGS